MYTNIKKIIEAGEAIQSQIKEVKYDASEDWIVDPATRTIVIVGLDGKSIVVDKVVFYDPVGGFIQTPDTLYVPFRNLGE